MQNVYRVYCCFQKQILSKEKAEGREADFAILKENIDE